MEKTEKRAVAFPRVTSYVSAWPMMFQPVTAFDRSLNSWENNSRIQFFFPAPLFVYSCFCIRQIINVLKTSHAAEMEVSLRNGCKRERLPVAAASIRPSFSSLLPSSVHASLSHLLYIQDRVNWQCVCPPKSLLCACLYISIYLYI